jgi:hypothetical protein
MKPIVLDVCAQCHRDGERESIGRGWNFNYLRGSTFSSVQAQSQRSPRMAARTATSSGVQQRKTAASSTDTPLAISMRRSSSSTSDHGMPTFAANTLLMADRAPIARHPPQGVTLTLTVSPLRSPSGHELQASGTAGPIYMAPTSDPFRQTTLYFPS